MRNLLAVLTVIVFSAGAAWSQSNDILDEILAADEGTFGQAVYLASLASGAAATDSSITEVYRSFDWGSWNVRRKAMEDPVTLGEYSYLIMENLGISGGIMYGLAPGPRYAARELAYLDFFLGSNSPYRSVPGEEMLHIMGQALAYVEAGEEG